jgi:hypothetical protein
MLNLLVDNVNCKLQIQTKLNVDICCNLQHEETLYEKGTLSSTKEVNIIGTGIVTSRNISSEESLYFVLISSMFTETFNAV